jgi:hypothetical protein
VDDETVHQNDKEGGKVTRDVKKMVLLNEKTNKYKSFVFIKQFNLLQVDGK